MVDIPTILNLISIVLLLPVLVIIYKTTQKKQQVSKQQIFVYYFSLGLAVVTFLSGAALDKEPEIGIPALQIAGMLLFAPMLIVAMQAVIKKEMWLNLESFRERWQYASYRSIIVLGALAILLLFISVGMNPLEDDEGFSFIASTVSKNVAIYSDPSDSSQIIGYTESFESVVFGETVNGWKRMRRDNGQIGWIKPTETTFSSFSNALHTATLELFSRFALWDFLLEITLSIVTVKVLWWLFGEKYGERIGDMLDMIIIGSGMFAAFIYYIVISLKGVPLGTPLGIERIGGITASSISSLIPALTGLIAAILVHGTQAEKKDLIVGIPGAAVILFIFWFNYGNLAGWWSINDFPPTSAPSALQDISFMQLLNLYFMRTDYIFIILETIIGVFAVQLFERDIKKLAWGLAYIFLGLFLIQIGHLLWIFFSFSDRPPEHLSMITLYFFGVPTLVYAFNVILDKMFQKKSQKPPKRWSILEEAKIPEPPGDILSATSKQAYFVETKYSLERNAKNRNSAYWLEWTSLIFSIGGISSTIIFLIIDSNNARYIGMVIPLSVVLILWGITFRHTLSLQSTGIVLVLGTLYTRLIWEGMASKDIVYNSEIMLGNFYLLYCNPLLLVGVFGWLTNKLFYNIHFRNHYTDSGRIIANIVVISIMLTPFLIYLLPNKMSFLLWLQIFPVLISSSLGASIGIFTANKKILKK